MMPAAGSSQPGQPSGPIAAVTHALLLNLQHRAGSALCPTYSCTDSSRCAALHFRLSHGLDPASPSLSLQLSLSRVHHQLITNQQQHTARQLTHERVPHSSSSLARCRS